MRTVIEADREGRPLRVFHATKTRTWTHALEQREDGSCLACTEGKLPEDIKKGGKP